MARRKKETRRTVRSGVVYNENGEPFSRWKPAEKYAYTMQLRYPEWWGYVLAEYKFDERRGWRWDYAWPRIQAAVEIHGFGWGHQAQQQIALDHEKHNCGVLLGWKILILDSRMLGSKSGVESAADDTARLIEASDRLDRPPAAAVGCPN